MIFFKIVNFETFPHNAIWSFIKELFNTPDMLFSCHFILHKSQMSLNLEQKIIFLTWFFVFIIHCAEIMANFTKVIAPIITRKHIKGKILKIRNTKKEKFALI